MGIFSRLRSRRSVDLDDRSPKTGVKFKDLLVLEQMVKGGADMTAPRHVLYYLYFDSETEARGAARDASANAFEVEVREPHPDVSPQWSLVCERHDYVLDLDAVRTNTDDFEAIALRHGGDFDGWEASLD